MMSSFLLYVMVHCFTIFAPAAALAVSARLADSGETEATFVKSGFTGMSRHWRDTDGRRIEAHGAGMLQSPHDGRWYWYGESRKGDLVNPGVNVYSAETLAGPWKSHGRVLSSSDIKVDGWNPPFVVERPKVIYNKKTKKYVMWTHIDHHRSMDYLTAHRKPAVTKQECHKYVRTVTCAWTNSYNCPFQRPGKKGMAGADGSIGYQCCCDMKLWTKVRRDECADYKGTNKCDWTQRFACPGQPAGTRGFAEDDRSVGYQCCCSYGHWKKNATTEQTASLLQEQSFAQYKRSNLSLAQKKGAWRRRRFLLFLARARREAKTAMDAMVAERTAQQQQSEQIALRFKRLHRFSYRYRRAAEYILRRVAVATSDLPAGPFEVKHILAPDGLASLDLNLWTDTDGTAYFIRSCDNAFTGISRLTDDYLNTTGLLSKGPRFEGMALFRHTNGTLYMLTSHLTGWNPNPLMLYRSDGPSLADPRWVDLGNPTKDHKSFNTQPTYVVQYTTKSGFSYSIYMADNWVYGGRQGLFDATYVWLPIRFDGKGDAHLDRLETWDLEDPFKGLETETVEQQQTAVSMRRTHRKDHHRLHRDGSQEVVDEQQVQPNVGEDSSSSRVRRRPWNNRFRRNWHGDPANVTMMVQSLAQAILPAWAMQLDLEQEQGES